MDVLSGPVALDSGRRRANLGFARRARAAALALTAPAVISAHEWLPYLRVLAHASGEGEVTYVYVLRRAQVDSLLRRGIRVYDLLGADDYAQEWYGYSLRAAGSRPLAVP